ncbi:hypothetical protein GSI_05135 [Ganoderma sinense ZZ0214-1]|uniref:Uncharacterized protein n=1 Tax=Ganoderma sinense ZZ0214-1 TaxID=1077348 RepID=A0A2G8SFA2_9APHY|nr:hypothetical protein GSI_05135 [Ganoderma sinense ZZ0214-1]
MRRVAVLSRNEYSPRASRPILSPSTHRPPLVLSHPALYHPATCSRRLRRPDPHKPATAALRPCLSQTVVTLRSRSCVSVRHPARLVLEWTSSIDCNIPTITTAPHGASQPRSIDGRGATWSSYLLCDQERVMRL